MRHRGIVCALIWGVWQFVAMNEAGAQEPAFYWRTDLEQVLNETRSAPRLIWVQFTGSWCHYCRRMDSEVFPWAPVASLARSRFQPVLVHSDHREDLMAHFGVAKLPTTIILDPSGREVARVQGYRSPEQFLGFLLNAEAQVKLPEPVKAEPLGLAGNCLVSLIETNRVVPGRAEFAAQYDGIEYRFQDQESLNKFEAEPIKYLPSRRGSCPVSLLDQKQEVSGDARFAVYYKERLFLCKDEATRQLFAKDPERFSHADLAGDGYCPHCREQDGKLVRGTQEWSEIHNGLRYQFPDSTHRQAFHENPGRYLR